MATITNDIVTATPPKKLHSGANIALFKVSLSATFSAGDVFRIGKLPHGAIPVDAVFYPGAAFTNLSTGAVMKLGTSASQDLFFASATYSQTTQSALRTTRSLGTRVAGVLSRSDDDAVRYDYVTFVPTAGTSVGHIGDLVVTYVANESA